MNKLKKIEVTEKQLNQNHPNKSTYSSRIKKYAKKIPGTVKIKHFFKSRKVKSSKSDSFPYYMFRPFTVKDFKPRHEQWKVGEPDFIGLGAPKAGTSWWYSLLKEHPQVVENRLGIKELHYFLHFNNDELDGSYFDTYKQAFASPRGAICGEWSTPYLNHPFCIESIAKAAPNSKILVLLRNPIDRMISHLNHVLLNRAKKFNLDSEKQYIFKTYSIYPEAILHSLYSFGLSRLLRHFDRSQILILFYEKCQTKPVQEIGRTYDFLGIDSDYIPEKNSSQINKQSYIIDTLTNEERQEERQYLAEYFRNDVKVVKQMFPELDFTFWSDFVE
jgi:hypothetical protein